MKKILPVVLILALAFAVSGCGKNKDDSITDTEDNNTEISENVQENENNIDDNNDVADPADTEEEQENTQDNRIDEEKPDNKTTEAVPSPNDPPTGDDHTLTGVPEPLDTLTSDDGNILVLVNKLHAVSSDYKPAGMVKMDNSLSTWSDLELKKEAYEAYLEMYEDAKELGYNLKVCSAYRTYSTQISLFNNSIKNRGWETTYLRSAYPGRSEHHTGLSIDITSASMDWGLTQEFANYEDGQWLNEHCQEYGFIVRYPKGKTDVTGYAYEPWHFRYVGVDAAAYIMENGITLEEYLDE